MPNKAEEWTPTSKQQQLLDVLCNPDCRYDGVLVICKKADVHHDTYYEAFKNVKFVEYYRQQCFRLVQASIGPIISTFTKQAIAGSFPHGKILLEMANMHSDSLELSGPGKGPIAVTDLNSMDNPKQKMQEYKDMIKDTGG